MRNAIVVGSGPNGLASAVTLAEAGLDVTVLEAADTPGGGARSDESTHPGLLHDHCSTTHPLGAGSPFLRGLDLSRHGLRWRYPAVDLTHPIEGGGAGVMVSSVDETARLLGADGPAWRRLFEPLSAAFDDLADDVLGPLSHLPRHPLTLARFGSYALLPATAVARRWRTERARALWAGVAAHGWHPLGRPASAAIGLMQVAAGHHHGWPVAEGGSRAITSALASLLAEHGGKIETGVRVDALGDLPPADVVLLDVAPDAVVRIAGDRLPPHVRRAYSRWRYGPAACTVALAVEGGIPWTDAHSRRAGVVHVVGGYRETVLAEHSVHSGRMPARPFVLVAQQYLADPGRSAGDVHPIDAYAHVPHGYTGDVTGAVLDQIERFAPGFRDRVVGKAVRTPAELARDNPNHVGGDILAGANTVRQLVFRPRPALDPYATGIPGVYLCSSATPPGPGVHGMCGHHAARSALRRAGR